MTHFEEDTTRREWKNCPLVEINPRKLNGTPILKGSRMPVEAIIQNYQSGLPANEIAEVFELPSGAVREFLAYAAEQDPTLQQ